MTTSQYSSDHGSYVVLGATTIISSGTTVTQFQTVTASPTAVMRSSGISSKDKGIAIGVGVGIGVPVVAVIIVVLLLLYRRKQRNSVQNYVDSNGKDAGIAVDDGNILKRGFRHLFIGLPTLKNNPRNDDFDDENDDEIINEPKTNFNANPDTAVFTRNGSTAQNKSANNSQQATPSTGFFVNRPKPLRLMNSTPSDTGSIDTDEAYTADDRVLETRPLAAIPTTLDQQDKEDEASSSNDTGEYIPAPDFNSNSSSPPNFGDFSRI